MEFVVFNKRSSFFLEGQASWRRRTAQISAVTLILLRYITSLYTPSQESFFIFASLFSVECQCFFFKNSFLSSYSFKTFTHCGLGVKPMPTTVQFFIFQCIFRLDLSDRTQHLCWDSFRIISMFFTFIGLISWSCFRLTFHPNIKGKKTVFISRKKPLNLFSYVFPLLSGWIMSCESESASKTQNVFLWDWCHRKASDVLFWGSLLMKQKVIHS